MCMRIKSGYEWMLIQANSDLILNKGFDCMCCVIREMGLNLDEHWIPLAEALGDNREEVLDEPWSCCHIFVDFFWNVSKDLKRRSA